MSDFWKVFWFVMGMLAASMLFAALIIIGGYS